MIDIQIDRDEIINCRFSAKVFFSTNERVILVKLKCTPRKFFLN